TRSAPSSRVQRWTGGSKRRSLLLPIRGCSRSCRTRCGHDLFAQRSATMTRRIVLGFAILAGWTLAGAPALASSDSPRALADEIFGQVDAMCGGDGNGPAYDLYEIAKAHFTPALEKTFETAMGSDDFGFDVLIDAQDCKTSDLKLSIVSQGDATATGRAT